MIGWSFPSNGGGGQIQGIANAGIQTFTGKEISSLAREICQNSLDAVKDENSPVTVEFYRYEIDTDKTPGYNDYKNILNKCRDYWKKNTEATDFLKTAIAQLNGSKIFVLRISDFNTTGLSKPFELDAQEGWNTLTKIDGGATKTGDAAGSFGIGKNAPFTNSYFRLIFYRTLNLQGERAAQGMSRLVSFALDDGNRSAGVGYYGEIHNNMPVCLIPELDNLQQRDKVGTDVFIYGFSTQKDWVDDIFVELIENFLVAVHRGKLRVKVQDIVIDKSNLSKMVNHYTDENRKAAFQKNAKYYSVLSDSGGKVKIFELKDFHNMGTFKLRVLCGENLSNKILVVRKMGMKLFEWRRSDLKISTFIKFAAVLELEGTALNSFFRGMETPAHDKWEYKRHKDKSTAQKYLQELKKWLKEKIESLIENPAVEKMDVTGLSDILNFDDGAVGFSKDESLDPKKNLDEKIPDDDKKPRVVEEIPGGEKKPGTAGRGNLPATIKHGDGHRKRIRKPTGTTNPDGKDTVKVAKKVDCEKLRVVKLGEKEYKLIFQIGRYITHGIIEIFAVGENDNGEKISVDKAVAIRAVSFVQASKDGITFRNLLPNANAQINFELVEEKNYALGVIVYEN